MFKDIADLAVMSKAELRMINDKFARAESTYRHLTDPRTIPTAAYGATAPHYQRQPLHYPQHQLQPPQLHPQQVHQQQYQLDLRLAQGAKLQDDRLEGSRDSDQSRQQSGPQASPDPMAGATPQQRAEYQAQWDQYYSDQRDYEAQQRVSRLLN